MNTEYYKGTLKADLPDAYAYADEESAREVAHCIAGEFTDEVNEANLARIRDTWNACQGLDLPEGLPPGILKEVVEALRHALPLLDDAAQQAALTAQDIASQTDRSEGLKAAAHRAAESLKLQAGSAREILAKLSA